MLSAFLPPNRAAEVEAVCGGRTLAPFSSRGFIFGDGFVGFQAGPVVSSLPEYDVFLKNGSFCCVDRILPGRIRGNKIQVEVI